MRFVSPYNLAYKSACLHTVSHTGLRVGYVSALLKKSPNKQGAIDALLVGFEIWLRVWLGWLWGADGAAGSARGARADKERLNRWQRRMVRRTLPPVRNLSPYRALLPRGLSATQYLDRMVRISPLGRIDLYRMKYMGTVLVRRALLVCYDHGWWRAPIGKFGRLYCGVWPIYAWKDRYLRPRW